MFYEKGIKIACTEFGLIKEALNPILRALGRSTQKPLIHTIGELNSLARTLNKPYLNRALGRTLLGAGVGAGLGAGLGSMTDVGTGAGALAGAAGGGLLGRFGPQILEKIKGLKRGPASAETAATESAHAGTATPISAPQPAPSVQPPPPTLPSVQDFVMRGKKGLVTQHSPELMPQLTQFTENPQAFHEWARSKGIDLTQAML